VGGDEKVNFDVVAWDETAERELGQIADAPDHINSWRLAWTEGRAQLWSINGPKGRVGSVLWEVIKVRDLPVIHVLAAATTDQKCSTIEALYFVFRKLRTCTRAASVYCETMRPGMVKILTSMGCEAAQIGPGRWGVTDV